MRSVLFIKQHYPRQCYLKGLKKQQITHPEITLTWLPAALNSWVLFLSQRASVSTLIRWGENQTHWDMLKGVIVCFIEFIGVILLMKLYRFQVYNSITHHLYIVLYAHHPKSSTPSITFYPPYPLLPLPTPFPSGNNHMWSIYEWLIFFFLLNLFTFFTQSPKPSPLTAVSLFSVSMSLFLFWLLVYFAQ